MKKQKTKVKVESKPKKKKTGIAEKIITGVIILTLLCGICLLCYPTFSNWYNQNHQSRAIAGYSNQVANLSDDVKERLRAEAEKYNADLLYNAERYFPTEEDLVYYNSLLNPTSNGIMGYIDIEKINVHLAVYHGTEDTVLQTGIGHIVGSSLPVGGKGTHVILSGHRGLPSSTLFTHLDRMAEGDVFKLHVLGETLTYQVDEIRTVLPDELNSIELNPDEDYVTLVTCTPYGINTHRLLVRGTRIPTIEDDNDEDVTAFNNNTVNIGGSTLPLWIIIVIALVILILIDLLRKSSKSSKNEDKSSKNRKKGDS